MPYYKIIIQLKNGKQRSGIRQIPMWNIDVVYQMVKQKANKHFGDTAVRGIEVYMLSRHSAEIKR